MSCLRLIGRLVALFIIFILVAITPPLILAYNAQQTAVSGDFLDELFEEPDLFEAAIPEMAQDLARDTKDNIETRDLAIARLDADGWERVIYAIAPPEAMQRWSQDAVQSFRRWVRRGGRFPDDVILPFGEIRDNIVNDPEQTVLRILTEAQPACSGGQEPLGGTNDLIPQCRPPEARREVFYQRLAERWREQPREMWGQLMPDDLAHYPDDISLADFVESESDIDPWESRVSWRMSRFGLRAANWFLVAFTAGQCVIALGLIALFAARNSREALRWVGTPLVLIGAFTLLLAFFFFVGGEFGTWFVHAEEVPIGVQEVMEDTGRAFVKELWPPMSWQGGMLILIGLGLWTLSFFTPVSYEVPPAPVAAPPAVSPVSDAVETASPTETMPVEPDASAPPETDLENQRAPDDTV